MKKEHKSCPSSTCEDGAVLLGVINEDGSVGYISTPITIDENFVKEAHKQGNPESNFRFSNTCVEAGCQQWHTGKCGVITKIMGSNANVELEPSCRIAPSELPADGFTRKARKHAVFALILLPICWWRQKHRKYKKKKAAP